MTSISNNQLMPGVPPWMAPGKRQDCRRTPSWTDGQQSFDTSKFFLQNRSSSAVSVARVETEASTVLGELEVLSGQDHPGLGDHSPVMVTKVMPPGLTFCHWLSTVVPQTWTGSSSSTSSTVATSRAERNPRTSSSETPS